MLISLKGNFALLFPPKTASTALSTALTPFAQIKLGGPKLKHISAAKFHEIILPSFNKIDPDLHPELVAVMREPVEWFFSWYKFRTRPELADPKHNNHGNYLGEISFDAFIEECAKPMEQRLEGARAVSTQSDFLCHQGKVAVNHLFRYDHLEQMSQWLSDRLGKKVAIHKHNVSPHREMKLSDHAKSILNEYLQDDLTLYETLSDGYRYIPS